MFQYIREIIFLLGKDLKLIPVILIFIFISSLFDLVGISIVGPYISAAINGGSSDSYTLYLVNFFGIDDEQAEILRFFGALLVLIFFFKTIFAIFLNWLIIKFSQRLQIKIRTFLMNAYQDMPYKEYLSRNSSEYIVNIQDLSGKYQAIVLASLRTLSDLIVAGLILSFLAYQNPMGLLILVSILLSFIFFYDLLFKNRMTTIGEEANLALDSLINGIQQGINGIKEIRILNKESYFLSKVKKGAEDLGKYQTLQLVISTSPRFLLEVFLIVFIVGFVYLGMSSETGLEGIVPVLGVFAIASLRLLPAANSISSNLSAIRYGRNGVNRLYKDYRELTRVGEISQKEDQDEETEFLEYSIKDISFTYDDPDAPILKDISLKINAGQSIGIIGESGSGKTTLVNLILGFLEPDKGQIFYNDQDLSRNIVLWKSKLGFIPQDIFLIDASIRENIVLDSYISDETDKKVSDAINKAKLGDFVSKLPEGLSTNLGERGLRLSGGQKQRVALARAFYHNREILILDEATSSLDHKTEEQIISEINLLKGQKTMITIAHRLSTIENCDYIYRLGSGRIIEEGRPEDLLNNRGQRV